MPANSSGASGLSAGRRARRTAASTWPPRESGAEPAVARDLRPQQERQRPQRPCHQQGDRGRRPRPQRGAGHRQRADRQQIAAEVAGRGVHPGRSPERPGPQHPADRVPRQWIARSGPAPGRQRRSSHGEPHCRRQQRADAEPGPQRPAVRLDAPPIQQKHRLPQGQHSLALGLPARRQAPGSAPRSGGPCAARGAVRGRRLRGPAPTPGRQQAARLGALQQRDVAHVGNQFRMVRAACDSTRNCTANSSVDHAAGAVLDVEAVGGDRARRAHLLAHRHDLGAQPTGSRGAVITACRTASKRSRSSTLCRARSARASWPGAPRSTRCCCRAAAGNWRRPRRW